MNKIILFFVFVFFASLTRVSGQSEADKYLLEAHNFGVQNNLQKQAETLNKLAMWYWENKQYEQSLEIFEKSIVINKEIGNENAIKAIYSNMGLINSDMGQLETALVFFRKSLLISSKLNNNADQAASYINMAVVLQNMNRASEALTNLEQALNIATQLSDKKLLRTCYGYLAEVHEKLGNSDKSFEYFSLYSTFHKKIQKEEMEAIDKESKAKVAVAEAIKEEAIIEKQKTEQELEKTQESLRVSEMLKHQQDIELENKNLVLSQQAAELKNQRLITLVFIVVLALVLVVVVFILRSLKQKKRHNIELEARNEEIRKQNEEIQAKNHKIQQSINYAQKIQGALLPETSRVNELFDDGFVFFSPRDVVSGDFYWFVDGDNFISVNPAFADTVYAAAVDCTGHGVPGAFMSMLGSSFLMESINNGLTEPSDILEFVHNKVNKSLKQESSGNSDGMDMALISYHKPSRELKFAGAVNPLVFVNSDGSQILKGDFFGIGGQIKGNERFFAQQSIVVDKPGMFYLFSDGFADQFGGENGKKYFSKRFRELLQQISSLPVTEQRGILEKELSEWHSEKFPRVDDVLVIGFKIT